MILGTYILMVVLPRGLFKKANLAFVLTYLSIQHIYRMMTNWGGWDMDVTSYTMLLTCRLWSIGFVVADGVAKDEDLNPGQQQRKMVKKPNLIEYLSYTLFCCTSMIGPFFEIRQYLDFIEEKGHFKNAPNGFLMSLWKIVESISCLACHMAVVAHFPPAACGTAEWGEAHPLYFKIFYYYVAMTGTRMLYYNAWKLGEAACIASGLAYNGKDKNGNHDWTGVMSVNIYEVDLGLSSASMVKYWNHTVHLWLNRYVFERVVPKGARPSMQHNMIVYMVSAFWHGFYPAYYVMFFLVAVFAELTKDIYRSRILFEFIPWVIAAPVIHVCTFIMMNYLGVTFGLLGL